MEDLCTFTKIEKPQCKISGQTLVIHLSLTKQICWSGTHLISPAQEPQNCSVFSMEV